MVVGNPVPILYVQMDGTGVPVVNKKLRDERARPTDNRLIRAKPN